MLLVITGIELETWTALPLDCPLVVTTAVKLPTAVGFTDRVTVNAVAVAVVTVPTAPLLKVTVFCEAVVLNPKPLMVTVSALMLCEVVFAVTTGRTEATWTAAPLV